MKKAVACMMSFVLMFLCGRSVAASYSVEQTYRILQVTAEELVEEVCEAGVSEETIAAFLTDVSAVMAESEELTEENFNAVMLSVMRNLLQSGKYNNLSIVMISLYSEQVGEMLQTKTIPEEFQPLYDTIRSCLLGRDTLQIFDDVPAGHWAKRQIEQLTADGVVSGMGNRLFAPENPVTREQFVKMATDGMQLPLCAGTDALFEDVQSGTWYSAYVETAYRNRLVSGMSETQFGIGQPIRRQDMALMVYRCLTEQGVVLEQNCQTFEQFEDAEEIDEYALQAVKALCGCDMISGISETHYEPDSFVTRAQAARMIALMKEKLYE